MEILENIGDHSRHPTGKGRTYSAVPVFVGSIEHIARLIQLRHHSASLTGSRLMAGLSYASLDAKGMKRAGVFRILLYKRYQVPANAAPPLLVFHERCGFLSHHIEDMDFAICTNGPQTTWHIRGLPSSRGL